MSIESIEIEHFSALPQTEIKASKKPFPRHEVFHYFLSDESKQNAATNTAHSNRLIVLLKKTKKTDFNIKYNMVKY